MEFEDIEEFEFAEATDPTVKSKVKPKMLTSHYGILIDDQIVRASRIEWARDFAQKVVAEYTHKDFTLLTVFTGYDVTLGDEEKPKMLELILVIYDQKEYEIERNVARYSTCKEATKGFEEYKEVLSRKFDWLNFRDDATWQDDKPVQLDSTPSS